MEHTLSLDTLLDIQAPHTYVVFDSAERLAAADWVRTGLAISEMTDGFLETRNTLYIALGNGQLKQASPALVMAIIEYYLPTA